MKEFSKVNNGRQPEERLVLACVVWCWAFLIVVSCAPCFHCFNVYCAWAKSEKAFIIEDNNILSCRQTHIITYLCLDDAMTFIIVDWWVLPTATNCQCIRLDMFLWAVGKRLYSTFWTTSFGEKLAADKRAHTAWSRNGLLNKRFEKNRIIIIILAKDLRKPVLPSYSHGFPALFSGFLLLKSRSAALSLH